MIAAALQAGLFCAVFGTVGQAEKLSIGAGASAGTGLSLTGSGGKTYTKRSPAFLIGEVGIIHPSIPWLEFVPSVMLELEGRVGVALVPKVRAYIPGGKRVRFWGIAAVPIFVAPYSLVGIQGGAGVSLSLHQRVALFGEFTAGAYVWGTDLMNGSDHSAALGKIDESLGVRVYF